MHIDELRIYMNISKLDILAINETKLDSSTSNCELDITGYDIVRLDREQNGRRGGGVCFYIRSNLNFAVRKDLRNKDLELLIIEISNPHSRPFLVGTWYRPPNSSNNLFSLFEKTIDMIGAENLELYLLGDLNCNILSDTPSTNTSELLNIFTTYNLNQLITEPTRVTNNSQTLIDLCVTNTPDKVRASGVLSIGISDHSLVYLVRKSTCSKPVVNLSVKKRCFKNFNEPAYLNDLSNLNWNVGYTLHDPNSMWDKWLNLLTSVIDKHAPIKKKRLGRRKSPWITAELIHKIRLRDNLKKRFDMTRNDELWGQYKKARNDCNNSIRWAKRHYFTTSFNAAQLINDLTARKQRNECNIKKIVCDVKDVTKDSEISDAFNTYFTSIGAELASNIRTTNLDAIPYIPPTDKVFTFSKINVDTANNLLKNINANKATGPDNISGRLLKNASDILSPCIAY